MEIFMKKISARLNVRIISVGLVFLLALTGCGIGNKESSPDVSALVSDALAEHYASEAAESEAAAAAASDAAVSDAAAASAAASKAAAASAAASEAAASKAAAAASEAAVKAEELRAAADIIFVENKPYQGKTYFGLWRNGKPDVYGALIDKSAGFYYLGGWKDGNFHSKGTDSSCILYGDGSRYCGSYVEGKPSAGDFWTADNEQYSIAFKDGVRTKYEKVKYPDKNRYSRVVWDNEANGSFHLYNGSSSLTGSMDTNAYPRIFFVSYGNGSYYIGTRVGGVPCIFGFYYDADTGDFFCGNYEANVTGGAIQSGKPTTPLVEKKSGVLADYRDGAIQPPPTSATPTTPIQPGITVPEKQQIPCIICKGQKKSKCDTCKGTGIWIERKSVVNLTGDGPYYVEIEHPCGVCAGKKEVDCRYCYGTGLTP